MSAPTASEIAPPGWLVASASDLAPMIPSGRRRRASFQRRTLGTASDALRFALDADERGERLGIVSLDARAKVVALLAALVGVALVRTPSALLVANAAVLAVAVLARLSLGAFVRRAWLAVPVFTGVLVLPATLSIVTPGRVVVPLWTASGIAHGLTQQGLTSAALIVLRVAASLGLVVLVTSTTPWHRLLAGLRGVGLPVIVVQLIGMTYRYLFLLTGALTDMLVARTARTIGLQHDAQARRFVGASVGTLLTRAHLLADEVNQAMIARGFTGRVRVLEASKPAGRDLITVAVVVAFTAALVVGDRLVN